METVESKWQTGDNHKTAGNNFFKAGDYNAALREYHSAVLYLKGLDNTSLQSFAPNGTATLDNDLKHKVGLTLLSTHLNMSAVYLKLSKFEKAIQSAETVIKMDPKNTKAIYRKGCALMGLLDYDKAEQVLKEGVKQAPTDPAMRKEYDTCKQKIVEASARSAEELKRNFAKMQNK